MKRGILSTSYRRRLLDKDLTETCASLQGLVLDLGGEWQYQRGTFRPPQRTDLRWICINIEPDVAPDVIADVACVPLVDSCADAVVCTEILEHVLSPETVLAEAHRLLQPGGQLILSMPFLCPVHADPHDYQRYTGTKLMSLLTEAELCQVNIRPQGLYFTVLADMVRGVLARLQPTLVRWILALFVVPSLDWLTRREARVVPSAFVASHVSGYFIIAHKPG